MADFENSRILPIITRRTLLAGTTTPMVAGTGTQTFAKTSVAPTMQAEDDPAVSSWREWKHPHDLYIVTHRTFLNLENESYRTTPLPLVEIERAALQTGHFSVRSNQDIDHYASSWIAPEDRPSIQGQLASMQSIWNRFAEHAGYRRAERAENQAWARRHKLAVSLAHTPALTLLGATAKLRSILETKMPVNRRHPKWEPGDPEFRKSFVAPEMDLLLADLERIGRMSHD